jgi:hypothetical protein
LFEHCKKNHEQCFLCLRRNIRHQYYDKYPDLVSWRLAAVSSFVSYI